VSGPGSAGPNASSMCGASLMNGDGRATVRQRRRRRYQKTSAISSAVPTVPPTTAPAICPAFDLTLLEPVECDVAVAVGIADGVPSGESWVVEGNKEQRKGVKS
jgi:hypothetical protein